MLMQQLERQEPQQQQQHRVTEAGQVWPAFTPFHYIYTSSAVVEAFGAWGHDMMALWAHLLHMVRMAGLQLESDDYAGHRFARQWLPAA